MNKTLLYLFSLVVVGCSVVEKKSSSSVYFAGEIVNPTSDYVVLYKGDVVIDSAKLDDQNRFAFELDSVDDGLHHFDHSPELQYVFIEEGDSLLIRLNTVDFDESLAFSGQGEEINNFLLDMFLTHEQEGAFIHSLFKLEPKPFCEKIDSLRNKKIELLQELQTDTPLSEESLEMAQASIDYNYYIYKEKYPFYHKRKVGEKIFHGLPDDFYGYRKDLSYNNKNLTYYRPYYNYMKYHYGNLSFAECSHKCQIENGEIKNNLHFYQHKLILIDSFVKQKNLRDNLFRNVAMDYLLKHDPAKNNEIFIKQFHKFSGNNKHLSEINGLYENIKKIQPNNALPHISVYDTEGNKILLSNIARKDKVVFYFWSGTQKKHFENITKHVSKLSEKYPDHTFIGLNVKTDPQRWLSMLDASSLDKTKQFRADNYQEMAHAMVVFDPNKGFIVEDGVIVDAFANLYTSF